MDRSDAHDEKFSVQFVSFQYLPPDIWRLLFWDFLTDIHDIIHFDTALCQKNARTTWLNLLRSNSFRRITLQPAIRVLDVDALEWLRRREIRAVEQLAGLNVDYLEEWNNFFSHESPCSLSRSNLQLAEEALVPRQSCNAFDRLRGLTIICDTTEDTNTNESIWVETSSFLSSCNALQGFGIHVTDSSSTNNSLWENRQYDKAILLLSTVIKSNSLLSLQLSMQDPREIPALTEYMHTSPHFNHLTALTLHLHFQHVQAPASASIHVVQILRLLPNLRIFDCFGYITASDHSLGDTSGWSNQQVHPELSQIRHLQLGIVHFPASDVNYSRTLTCYLLYKCVHLVSVAVTSHSAFQQAKLFAMSAEEHRGIHAEQLTLSCLSQSSSPSSSASPATTSAMSRVRHKYLRHVLRVDLSSCQFCSTVDQTRERSAYLDGIERCAKYALCLEGMSFTSRPQMLALSPSTSTSTSATDNVSSASLMNEPPVRSGSDADLLLEEMRLLSHLSSSSTILKPTIGDDASVNVNNSSSGAGIDFVVERSQSLHRMLRMFGSHRSLVKMALSAYFVAAAVTWSVPSSRFVSDSNVSTGSSLTGLTRSTVQSSSRSTSSSLPFSASSRAVSTLLKQDEGELEGAMGFAEEDVVVVDDLLPSGDNDGLEVLPISNEGVAEGRGVEVDGNSIMMATANYLCSAPSSDTGRDAAETVPCLVSVPSATPGGFLVRLLRTTLGANGSKRRLQSLTIDEANFDVSSLMEFLQLLPESTTSICITSIAAASEDVSNEHWPSSHARSFAPIKSPVESLQLYFAAQKLSLALLKDLTQGLGRLGTGLRKLKLLNIPGEAEDSYVKEILMALPWLRRLSLHRSVTFSGNPIPSALQFMPRSSFSAPSASSSFSRSVCSGNDVVNKRSRKQSFNSISETFPFPLKPSFCLEELELYGTFPAAFEDNPVFHGSAVSETVSSDPNQRQLSSSYRLSQLLSRYCRNLQKVTWTHARLSSQHLSLWLTVGKFPALRCLEFHSILSFVDTPILTNSHDNFDVVREHSDGEATDPPDVTSALCVLYLQVGTHAIHTCVHHQQHQQQQQQHHHQQQQQQQPSHVPHQHPLEGGGPKGWSRAATEQLLGLLTIHSSLTTLTLDGIPMDDALLSRLLTQSAGHLHCLHLLLPAGTVPVSSHVPNDSSRPGNSNAAHASNANMPPSRAPPGFGRTQSFNSMSMQQFLGQNLDPTSSSAALSSPTSSQHLPLTSTNQLRLEALTLDGLPTTSTSCLALRELHIQRASHLSWTGLQTLLSCPAVRLEGLTVIHCPMLHGKAKQESLQREHPQCSMSFL
jgi:hypothetical protein